MSSRSGRTSFVRNGRSSSHSDARTLLAYQRPRRSHRLFKVSVFTTVRSEKLWFARETLYIYVCGCVGVCISMLNEVKVGGLAQASSVVGGAPAVTSKNPCPTSSSARASNAHGPANTSILHSPTLFSHSPHRAAKPPSLLSGYERNDKG